MSARSCEWCGRSFVADGRQRSVSWLVPVSGVLIGMLTILLLVVAFASVRSSQSTRVVAEPPLSAALPEEIEEATPTAEPAPSPTSLPTATTVIVFPPQTVAVAPASEYVRIANTGGSGAFIRREPRSDAPGIVAYRDGTVLRTVGADTTVDGRVWRQVEDTRGNRGWTPQEYLDPSPTGF